MAVTTPLPTDALYGTVPVTPTYPMITLLASTSRSTSSAEAYDVTAVGGSAVKTIAADRLHAASRAARILVLFLILNFLLFHTIQVKRTRNKT